jgi:hypothetical protein
MAAWKPGKGTYEVDRIIAPLGRVRLRTGTRDARRAEAYDRMLDDLPLDLIRLLQAKAITLREVYERRRLGRPMPSAEELQPLGAALTAWLAQPLKPVGASEHTNRRDMVRFLGPLTGRTVAEFPMVVRALYERLRDAGHGATWNRRKSAAQAFARDVLGKRSALYAAVTELPRLPEPARFSRHPCTVAEAKQIRDALGPKWGPQWWTLCLTGMEPKEHWRDGWKILSLGVAIHGQKRPARERIVPLLGPLAAPVGTMGGFAEALERAALGVTPMDARRSYQRWLDEVGLPHYRQDAFAGHGPKAMRELYKFGDIRAWLEEDTRKLRAYVGEPAIQLAEEAK